MTMPAEPVTCRHCGRPITRAADDPASPNYGYWADEDGVPGCIKERPGFREIVYHEPMPAGLRGAPPG